MRFSTVAAVLPVGVALAQQTFNVTVGLNATLTYTPNQLTGVQTGDTINFIFAAGNHTATQSTFANPCTPQLTNGTALSTGFQFVPPGSTSGFPLVAITLNNVTGPLWFFCEQTNPKIHCQNGMVFAVNPTADKSFEAFQAAAQGLAANSTASSASVPAGSSTSAPPASSSGASSAGGSSDSISPSPTDSSSGSSSTDSGNPSTSSSGSSPSPTSNGAISARAGTAGVLLSGVAALAALAL